MNETCIFCKIAKKEIPSKIVFEDGEIVAFQDVNPQAPVHLLVIPRLHLAGVDQVEGGHYALVGKMIGIAKQLAAERKLAKGYRLVLNNGPEAGQSVFHIHLHVLGGRPMSWPPG